LLMEAGRPAEAERREALAIFKRLADDNPHLPYLREGMAGCLTGIGGCLIDQGRIEEAVDTLDQARGILAALTDADSSIEDYRNRLAFTHSGLGRAHRRAGAHVEALAEIRRAVALWEGLAAPSWGTRYALAATHARLAGLAAEGVSDLSSGDGPADAERATALLRPLVAEGYRNLSMRTDPALDPLRNRPDFQLIMMDFAMPAYPFVDRR
jgi:tetratricopeptide (TPR) repeat protein